METFRKGGWTIYGPITPYVIYIFRDDNVLKTDKKPLPKKEVTAFLNGLEAVDYEAGNQKLLTKYDKRLNFHGKSLYKLYVLM